MESAELTVHKARVFSTLAHGFSMIYAVKKEPKENGPKHFRYKINCSEKRNLLVETVLRLTFSIFGTSSSLTNSISSAIILSHWLNPGPHGHRSRAQSLYDLRSFRSIVRSFQVCELECHAGIRTRQVAPKTGVNRDRFLSLFNLKPLYIVVLYFIFCVVVKNRQTD